MGRYKRESHRHRTSDIAANLSSTDCDPTALIELLSHSHCLHRRQRTSSPLHRLNLFINSAFFFSSSVTLASPAITCFHCRPYISLRFECPLNDRLYSQIHNILPLPPTSERHRTISLIAKSSLCQQQTLIVCLVKPRTTTKTHPSGIISHRVALDTFSLHFRDFRRHFTTHKGMSVPGRHYAPIDGACHVDTHTRKASRSPPNDDVCCIYVHAGAGYHSHQNERIHLEACNE